MKKITFYIMAATLALTLASGCQSTVNSVENTDKSMTPELVNDTRFVTDGFLRDRLQLTRVVESFTPNGFMQVGITAVNVRTGVLAQAWSGLTGENPYKIQYRFSWYDADGMEVDSALSRWHTLTVIPGETVQIKGIAPRTTCKDFLLNLKELD